MNEFKVLLISTYELGHQPLGLASPAAFFIARGFQVDCLDLAVEPFDEAKVKDASFIGISVPMHTATRLGIQAAGRIRRIHPSAHICFYGLYASLNEGFLLKSVADSVVGGEFEAPLLELVRSLNGLSEEIPAGVSMGEKRSAPFLGRQTFLPPARHLLPPLNRYARLDDGKAFRLVGGVEASRGCAHHCRHCPITPVYEGRVRILQEEVVLEDIKNLVRLGAGHITFCDPDFLNGVDHSMRVVRAMRKAFPSLTFDMTAKIEHLIEYRDRLPELKDLGCLFIQSAVETLNDRILGFLKKGHTRSDIFEAVKETRRAGIPIRPSLISFTPWTTPGDFIEVLEFVESQEMIGEVDPIQFAIRLLIPPGSSLLQVPELKPFLGALDEEGLRYPWRHPDERMEILEAEILGVVEDAAAEQTDSLQTFETIRERTGAVLGRQIPAKGPRRRQTPARSPRLTESWFCCAEPNERQKRTVTLSEEADGGP